MLENTEVKIKKWTIQRHWQTRVHEDEENQKHNTICVGHHYTQTNTTNINKTWAPYIQLEIVTHITTRITERNRHFDLLGHIIERPKQPIFTITPQWCGFCWEATNTSFIVFGLNPMLVDIAWYFEICNYYFLNFW